MDAPSARVPMRKNPWLWLMGGGLLLVCCVGTGLGATLWPVFTQARIAAIRGGAVSNLRMVASATLLYAEGNDGYLPCRYTWTTQAKTKASTPAIFTPPNPPEPISYAYAEGLDDLLLASVETPSNTLMHFESILPPGDNSWGSLNDSYRRDGRTIVSLVDGRAVAMTADQLAKVIQVPLEEDESH